MAYLFWMSIAVVFYTYAGYPLCLALLKRMKPRVVKKGEYEPCVSVILAACNEEHNIAKRIGNLARQDYPSEKIQIVVVSDGSEDRTVEYACRAGADNLEVVPLPQRIGKAAAVNAGMARATGDIVIFCDARQSFDLGVIRELAANFADPSVGCVSGELMLVRRSAGEEETEMGAYWRYEKWIRQAESSSGSVMGATGAVYAIRRHLYRKLAPGTLLDDVVIPMQIVMLGYRVVFDGRAKAYDIVSQNVSQEWVRKVRTLAGNWQILSLLPGLLLPWRNPFCWRYLSHKVLRLLVPAALVLVGLCGSLLQGEVYRVAVLVQVTFYGLAALGAALPAARSNRVVSLSYFFVVMNAVAVAGFWRWATRRSDSAWRPAYVKTNR